MPPRRRRRSSRPSSRRSSPRSGRELRVDPRGAGRLDAVLLACPRRSTRIRGRAQAARRIVGASAAGTARARPAPVLGSRPRWRADAAAGSRAGPRRGASRSRSPPTSSPTCPVASFLSGGLDSSIITALAAPPRPRRSRPTRSPSAPRTSGSRRCPTTRVYARKMAAHLGITLHEIEISPDVVDLLPRIVDMLDEPIGDPAAINTLLMCQAARDAGVKVLLSGHGRRRALRRLPQAPRLPARRAATSGVPRPLRDRRRRPVGATGCRSPSAAAACATARWAKRFLTFAELPEEAAFRRSYTLYDRGRAGRRCSSPDLGRRRRRRRRRAPRRLPDTTLRRPRQPDVPRRLAGCSCPASTSPTPTGRAWPPRPRCGCRSSTRSSSGPRSRSRASARSAAGARRSPLKRGGRGVAAAARSSTGRRPPSARRCAPGSPTTCSELIDDVLVDGELAGAGVSCARPRCAG